MLSIITDLVTKLTKHSQSCGIIVSLVAHDFNICLTVGKCLPYEVTASLNLFKSNILEYFVYFVDQPSVWCRVGEDLFPFCRLSFCLVDCVICFTEAFLFQEVPFFNCFSQCLCYWGYIKKLSPVPMNSSVLSTFIFCVDQCGWLYVEVFDPFGLEFCASW